MPARGASRSTRVAPTPSGPRGAQWAPWARFFGKGYDRRSRRNLPVGTASTLTPGQAGDDRPRKERLMPRGRARQGKAEAFMVKSGELLGWALGGVEREIAETRKRLSTLMAQACEAAKPSGIAQRPQDVGGLAACTRQPSKPAADVRRLEETHRGGRQARGGAQAAPQLGLSPSVFSLQSLVAKSPVGPRAWRPGSPPGRVSARAGWRAATFPAACSRRPGDTRSSGRAPR